MRAAVEGVVLNGFDVSMGFGYKYRYSNYSTYGYYTKYGYSSPGSSKGGRPPKKPARLYRASA